MATSLDEQTKEKERKRKSCCVCYDTFNDKTLKPKISFLLAHFLP